MNQEKRGIAVELSLCEAEALYLLLRGAAESGPSELSSVHRRLESSLFNILSIEEMETLEERIATAIDGTTRRLGGLSGFSR
jgi:hypothetical protein